MKLVVNYFTYAVRPVASARRAACRVTRRRQLRLTQAHRQQICLRRASWCLGTSRGSSHSSSLTTSTTPPVRVPRHVARLITRLVAPLVVDYFAYAVRPGAAARRAARREACPRLLHLRRASGCFGTSRGLSRDSSSTTSPHAGSSSTTSPTPHVQVPRHVARLVVKNFDYAAHPGASARRAAHHATRRAARRRLLRLRRAFGCFGTSRSSSCGSSSTTLPTPCVRVPRHVARLVVENFDYAVRPGASARGVAHHATRRAAHRRLLRLRRVSGCLGTSRGSSRGSSSTTSPTPRVRLLRHVARLVA
jgi:hypothetical protein